MALGPLYSRTTTSMMSNSMLGHLNRTGNDLFTLQEQLATGRRILRPSMDAYGTTEFLGFQTRQTRNSSFLNTATDLTNKYNFLDSQIGDGADTLNRLKAIALRESNDGASDADTRSLSATEANELRNAIIAMANAEFQGQSVFGGRNTTEEAFTLFGDALVFNGTHDVNERKIGENIEIESSMTAQEVFGELQTVSASRVDLNAAVNLAVDSPTGSQQVSTPLSALNGGAGVDTGVLSVAVWPDGEANPSSQLVYDVDLRGARSIADVIEAFNNTRGADGEPVFDATIYTAAGTEYPAGDENRISGLRISAVGEAASAIVGKPAQIQFIEKPGRTTARDLGLLNGEIDYQITSDALSTTNFAQTFDFDLNVNGVGMNISVTPSGATIDDFAAALETEVRQALGVNNLYDFNVSIAAIDSNNDAVNDSLTVDITDGAGTGSFELNGTSANAVAIDDAIKQSDITREVSFNRGNASFAGGIFGGSDLNPALSLGTALSDLRGGEGLMLNTLADGTVVQPQGLRIENGSLAEDIDLSDLIGNPNANVGDLINRINGSGVQVTAQISEEGDRLEITSNLIGVPVKISNMNGSIGSQLGVETQFNEMRLIDLNDGRGVTFNDGADLRLTTATGNKIEVDLGDANTVKGIVDAINLDSANRLPNGSRAFDAKAVTERTFETGNVSGMVGGPSPTFEVSLNGMPTRALELGGPFATIDDLATAMENGVNAIADQQGLDGYSVRVHADKTLNRLDFQIQDENGSASIDFNGGFTNLFELDGSVNRQGIRSLNNEQVQNRFLIQDNTFDAANFEQGNAIPLLENVGVSSVLSDLGISQSDAQRVQHLGSGLSGTFDPAANFDVTLDFARGPQLAINVAASAGRSLANFVSDLNESIDLAINAAGIEGLTAVSRIDSQSGNLMIEVSDGFDDARLTVAGANAADIGMDTANVTSGAPSGVVFNFATSQFEGKNHSLSGIAADNVFTAVNDLIRGLQSNSATTIAATLDEFDSSLNRFLEARGTAGTRVLRLELANNRLSVENDRLGELSDKHIKTDLAQAAVDMARKDAVFQAGVNATSRILRVSVLDFL